jgi:hypothetical protein
MKDFVDRKADLDAVLAEAVRALTVLDAEAIEALAEWLEGNSEKIGRPGLSADWARLRSRRWILGYLLDGTGKRLEMLRRVSIPETQYGARGGRAIRCFDE